MQESRMPGMPQPRLNPACHDLNRHVANSMRGSVRQDYRQDCTKALKAAR
jgi:hypothetical protein